MTDLDATERAVKHLRAQFAVGDRAALISGIEALRALEPDHPDVHLATASLLEMQGLMVEAVAARIRGYARAVSLTGDPTARALLNGVLARALNAPDGYEMLRPAALESNEPAILEAFVTVACNHGHFDAAACALRKLQSRNGGAYRDAADAISLGQGITALLTFKPDSVIVHPPAEVDWEPPHHSAVAQAVIGAAARRGRLTAAFAQPLAASLAVTGVLNAASVLNALRLLLVLGGDACCEAFLKLMLDRLSAGQTSEFLDHAIVSATNRSAVEAALRYGRLLDQVTACPVASLYRLSSRLGVRAHRQPAWSAVLNELQEAQRNAREIELAPLHLFPASDPAYRSDERIDVFLKCVKRPFDIHPFVSFWMACFNDPARYRIRLLDDSGLDLAGHYDRYPIAESRSLRDGPNEARVLFKDGRRPLNLLGWESIANLTPFELTGSRWFWNIDADDIRPLLDPRTTLDQVRAKLRAVEDFAADADLMAISYDLWASAHYLFDHGYHWTFGICLCRSNPQRLGRMLASMAGCDLPAFRINLDHLFSRLSDGSLAAGRYSSDFASFIFDGPPVLQKDVNGSEVYHYYAHLKKRLAFDVGSSVYVQNHLHPKTLVV
ncbi:hypothetical protein [Methylobacterium sp. A54F]